MEKLINFFKDEEGASMVEYGLLIAFIAIVAVAALGLLGTSVKEVFEDVTTELDKRPA
jgi:pilus assembly protein Flp/PilA